MKFRFSNILRKRLYAGTVTANKEYAAGSVPANKKYAAGTPKKFKFKTKFPNPLKAPLVQRQECQSVVQRLRGTGTLVNELSLPGWEIR